MVLPTRPGREDRGVVVLRVKIGPNIWDDRIWDRGVRDDRRAVRRPLRLQRGEPTNPIILSAKFITFRAKLISFSMKSRGRRVVIVGAVRVVLLSGTGTRLGRCFVARPLRVTIIHLEAEQSPSFQ